MDLILKETQHNMALEKQGLQTKEKDQIEKNLVDEVLLKNEKQIWKK